MSTKNSVIEAEHAVIIMSDDMHIYPNATTTTTTTAPIPIDVDDDIDPERQIRTTRSKPKSTYQQPSSPIKPQSSSTCTITSVLQMIMFVAIVFGLLFGILSASGALDKKSPNRNQQDDLNKDPGNVRDVCDFQQKEFDIRNDGSLLLRQYINTGDNTVTVQLEYNDIGWVGMAFSESSSMIPNTAIIGLPDTNTVQKYSLVSKSLAGVTPLDTSQQTLSNTSIVQEDGRTILTFTKKLIEDDEVSVKKGENRFNWAFGSNNDLGFHLARGSATLIFDQCLEQKNIPEENLIPPVPISTTPPTIAPIVVSDNTNSPVVPPSVNTNSPVGPPSNAPIVPPTATAAPVDINIPPTTAPVFVATPTLTPTTADGEYPVLAPTTAWTGTWSKRGNRRSCGIAYCPSTTVWTSDNITSANLGYGCSCTNGLNSCYWDNTNATTIEQYTEVSLLTTNIPNVWQLSASGTELNLGEGSDFATGSECYDDPLRGGFRVDLSGTGLKFYDQATVTVTGYSPAMRMIADGIVIDEWTQYATNATFTMNIPSGSSVVDVSCGGWPASCSSKLLVTLA